MADRGEYRSLYVAFWDNADVHALSDRAYRVLTTLRGTLGGAGIGVVYLAVLAARCRCTEAELEPALRELERVKPDEEHGWIVREQNIVWVVNALEYEPTLSESNAKHKVHVQRQLNAIGSRRDIAAMFRQRYPKWFDGEQVKPDAASASERVSDGSRTALDRVSKHRTEGDRTSPDITSPSSSSPAREGFVERFASVPGGEAAVTAFLDGRPANRDEGSLIALVEGWLSGLGMPAGKAPALSVVASALADYAASPGRDYNAKHLRSFVVREMANPPKAGEASNGNGKHGRAGVGQRAFDNAMAALGQRSDG